MQVNAKTNLSHLIELVEQGETIIIARHGKPVAKLVTIPKQGLPLGIASHEPLVPKGDKWWQPMTDKESEKWIEGV
jgi:antitoxin (DNA-binding transcriptional repressor) of toxin-antitoxin stability system